LLLLLHITHHTTLHPAAALHSQGHSCFLPQAAELFGLIIDTWSMRLDSVSKLQCRKLTGLAIANLLPVADTCVTSRFDTLVNMCVDVLHDVMDTTDDNQLYE